MSRKTAEKHLPNYRSVGVETLLKECTPMYLEGLEKLDLELLLLYQRMAPTQIEMESRDHVFNKVKELILVEFQETEVVTFGSHSTGLVIPSSDIDIGVMFQAREMDRERCNKYLVRIKNILSRSELVLPRSLLHIRNCKTPILKFKDKMFGFKIDISVNQKNGMDAADFVSSALRERPYMKVFVILLKHFLSIRNQSDAATGGLNSYSQFLLLLSFFQQHPLVQRNRISPLKNIGVLFVDFFQFYGRDFAYKTKRISVNNMGYTKNNFRGLSVEDPTDMTWNVASGCRNYPEIVEMFRHAFRVMESALSVKTEPRKSLSSLWFRDHDDEEWRESVRKTYLALEKARPTR